GLAAAALVAVAVIAIFARRQPETGAAPVTKPGAQTAISPRVIPPTVAPLAVVPPSPIPTEAPPAVAEGPTPAPPPTVAPAPPPSLPPARRGHPTPPLSRSDRSDRRRRWRRLSLLLRSSSLPTSSRSITTNRWA